MMKRFLLPLTVLMAAHVSAAEEPAVFSGLLEKDIPVRAQIGVVVPPAEIDKYVALVERAASTNKEWFREQSAKAKPGAPLPFHENLGLTKEQYDEYLKLWAKREFKPQQEVILVLRQSAGQTWSVTCMGGGEAAPGAVISTLRFSQKDNSFHSPNGILKPIEDIKADGDSILGAWSGKEWKFEEETTLARTKENVAFGRFADNKYGLIVYRVQEISTEGSRLLDKSLVIRFPLGKAGQVSATPGAAPAAAAAKPGVVAPAKPAPAKPAAAKPAPAPVKKK